MKKISILLITLFSFLFTSAQHLKVEKNRSQLFITHRVSAKETMYSLARQYELAPKDIAIANKLKKDAGLQAGQEIKIPLNKTNFIQKNQKSKQGLQPVYHTVKKGENLYRLSTAYNKVDQKLLKQWNKLKKNSVSVGQDIIIGYVKYSSSNADVAKNSSKAIEDKSLSNPSYELEDVKPVQEKKDLVKEAPAQNGVKQTNNSKQEEAAVFTASAEGSYFESNFSVNAAMKAEKKISGLAATFKSTSGWNDKKFYVLTNGIAPETIVKITADGKSVYAKVLEVLPDIKENNGLVCRLSNATASALGITDAKFNVEIVFFE
jgi:LysM repeat protein